MLNLLPARLGGPQLSLTTFLIEPFDFFMHDEESNVLRIQAQFSAFLRGLTGPARFVTWHAPTTLQPLIEWTIQEARATTNPWRSSNLMQYRQYYEQLQRQGRFQQALCGAALWTPTSQNTQALAAFAQSYFGARVSHGDWPALMAGEYHIASQPFWHLEPVGRPLGRPLICLLGSYEFRQVEWTFFRPLIDLFLKGIPIALSVDIPRTWDTADAIASLEGVVTALQTLAIGSSSIDANGQRQVGDALATINDLQNGQNLHDVQIKIAVAAGDAAGLKESVDHVRNHLKPFVGIRHEVGADQVTAARYFSSLPTVKIEPNPTVWPMTSNVAALTLGFLGVRKLRPRPGIIRGINQQGIKQTGGWPYIYDDWNTAEGKKATHELWVGMTGAGKTFALNCYLARTLAHFGTPFDLLEPLGHGLLLANAFHIKPYSLSARKTCLNPLDPVYGRIEQQLPHVLMLFEIFLQRPLTGTQIANHQLALLSQAIHRLYDQRDLLHLTPDQAPLVEDVCTELHTLGETDATRQIARELAEEVSGLATGNGPYGHFLNGHTDIDFSIQHETQPRIFCFHEMEDDPVLVAIAYTQVLATLMRTAMADENPRVIAVDEVYRMMRHPNLLNFLITAVKTLRTKRKKVIVIDQQLRVFLEDPKARLLFENCPIRVIFQQKGGEDILANDPAFSHYTAQHRKIISLLPPFHFVMETPEGLFNLASQASYSEMLLYGTS